MKYSSAVKFFLFVLLAGALYATTSFPGIPRLIKILLLIIPAVSFGCLLIREKRKGTGKSITAEFDSFINISELLNREWDIDKLLNLIVKEVTKLLNAERATIFLFNEETNELWSYMANELEIREIRLPLGKGIAGYVAQTGKTLNIKDTYNDSRFDSSFDKSTGYVTRNILCAPMFNRQNKLLGVIQILNKLEGDFTGQDELLLGMITTQSSIAIENVQLYTAQENLFGSLIKTLVATIDARDPVTSGHSERVSRYSLLIGKKMGFQEEELKILEYSSLLHDVGKIGVKDSILSKPGKFTSEEYDSVKQHPIITREILDKVYFTGEQKKIPMLASIHHEKLDGSGYPYGYKIESIPLTARIIAVADIYDALVSYDRPYKPALTIEEAIKILKEEAGKGKLDREVVDIFINNKLYELARRKLQNISDEFSIEYRILGQEERRNLISIIVKAKDSGKNGIIFTSNIPLPVDSFLEVRVHMPSITVDALAKVVLKEKNEEGYRVGINFINLNDGVKTRLAEYLVELK